MTSTKQHKPILGMRKGVLPLAIFSILLVSVVFTLKRASAATVVMVGAGDIASIQKPPV